MGAGPTVAFEKSVFWGECVFCSEHKISQHQSWIYGNHIALKINFKNYYCSHSDQKNVSVNRYDVCIITY